jgi:hypothetical protein
MISLLVGLAVAQAQPASRTFEADWYISDQTDNNTGEREVYAFQTYLKKNDPNFVTLTMRCSKGKPTFFVEWHDLAFPDQTVLTLGPVANPDAEPAEERYVFEKSEETLERGLRASPDTSAKIVAAIGLAKYSTVTAHLASGTRTVGVDVDGTQRAWSRVSRHCPVRIMPRPPL